MTIQIATHCIKIDDKNILKLGCIYGANASGKTNMLKALYFYINFILTSFTDLKPAEKTNLKPFSFDKKTNDGIGEFEIIFYLENIRYEYNLALNKKEVVKESLYYAPKKQKKTPL